MFPTERPCRVGLVETIDLYSIVGSSSTETVSIIVYTRVSRGTRVDKQGMSTHVELHAQSIGVAMACSARTMRASVNNEPLRNRSRVAHHVGSAGLKRK